jgi:hypothetical protein
MSRFTAFAAAAATAALLAGVHPPLQAQPEPSLADVSLPRLKSMVLHCDLHPSATQELSFTTAFCAHATGELRERAFDGDPERLAGWLRDERSRLEVDAAPAPEQAAQAERPEPRATPEQLKSSFLACDRLSQETALDSGTAAQCSVVYEELKQRVFAGDFERLLAWWRVETKGAVAQETASASP